MDLKGTLYNVVGVAWMGLAFGAWIYVDLGHTEPWLTFSEVPGGKVGAFAIAMGVTTVGWYAIGKHKERHGSAAWRKLGRQAGLHPADDPGDRIVPELTGTVDGRSVTASYDVHSVQDGKTVTYTFAGADLARPTQEGVIAGSADGRVSVRDGVGTLVFEDLAETAAAMDELVVTEMGALVLVGTSDAAVESVAGGLSGDALLAFADLQIASIGDAAGVVASIAAAHNEEMEGFGSSWAEYPVENFVDRVPGDPATVTVETKASIEDGDDLRRFTEGVVAIADAFEETTSRTPSAGEGPTSVESSDTGRPG